MCELVAAILPGVPAQKHPRLRSDDHDHRRKARNPARTPAGANTRPSGYTGPVTVRVNQYTRYVFFNVRATRAFSISRPPFPCPPNFSIGFKFVGYYSFVLSLRMLL